MNMEYDFVPAPTDAEEFEQWRREQAKIIEELHRDLNTTKTLIDRAQQELQVQCERLEQEKRTERDRIAREKSLFDMKWKVLESETQKLADDKQKFEREKAFYSKVLKFNEENPQSESVEQITSAQIFFIGVGSEKSLKKRYKDLLKIYHPDNLGGDTGTIQEINQDETITSLPYISVYNLNYLNQRLEKVIHFDNITKFRDCLISNLNEKTLIIKPPYKNAVATKWRIFPKNSNKKNTFELISSSNYDKGLSLIFFGENSDSKNIIKELETIIQKKPFSNIEKLYLEYIYDDRLVKNIVILPIEKKTSKEIVSNFSEIINLKNGDSGKILIFFDHEKLADTIKMIFDKFYTEPIFVIIFTSEDLKEIKKKLILN